MPTSKLLSLRQASRFYGGSHLDWIVLNMCIGNQLADALVRRYAVDFVVQVQHTLVLGKPPADVPERRAAHAP